MNYLVRWIKSKTVFFHSFFNFLKLKGRKVDSYQPLSFNYIDEDFFKNFVYEWNNEYPIDHWWREKHGIAFMSPQHRNTSLIDIRIEWEEEQLYHKLREKDEYKKGEYLKETIEEEKSKEDQLKEFLEEEADFNYEQYND